jgi:hypothetical protein
MSTEEIRMLTSLLTMNSKHKLYLLWVNGCKGYPADDFNLVGSINEVYEEYLLSKGYADSDSSSIYYTDKLEADILVLSLIYGE